jgi:tRNA 2-thiouridine synthesizing protein A
LKCPLPLLKLKQALNSLAVGESVYLSVTDRASLRDFKSFISVTEHSMQVTEQANAIHFYVTKG